MELASAIDIIAWRKTDNEKLYHVFRLISYVIRIYYNMFYHLLFHFIHFAVVREFRYEFESKLEKEQKCNKRARFCPFCPSGLRHVYMEFSIGLPATSFNDQGNVVHHFPNGVRHYHAEEVLRKWVVL